MSVMLEVLYKAPPDSQREMTISGCIRQFGGRLTFREEPAVTETGLNETVVPAGWPVALSVTVCAEPLVTVVEIVEVPLPPCARLRLDGLAEIEKSDGGASVTVRLTAVACVALAPVPVTVIV